MSIKRLTAILVGFAGMGLIILGCENMDGPAPYLSKPLQNNQLSIISPAAVPVGEPVSLNDIKMLVITDDGIFGFLQADTEAPSVGVLMDEVGKIIFQ